MHFKRFCGFLLVFILIDFSAENEKTWRFDSDISNSMNWIGGKLSANCKGIHFAQINSAPIYIKELTTAELTLPEDGEIALLDQGTIELRDNKKCIKLKPLDYHNWYDPDSWTSANVNSATPDKERIPCIYDQVVFPKGIHTRAVESLGSTIETNSIKLGSSFYDNNGIKNIMDTIMGKQIFYNPIRPLNFIIKKNSCTDPFGCMCHEDFIPCVTELKPKTTCLNPIQPEGFCQEICGAYLTYKPETGPNIASIRQKLTQSKVDTYVSRVKDYLGNDVIQVVFSEKDYAEKSLDEAKNFLEYLKNHQAQGIQIQEAGRYYSEGSGVSTVSIIFGTLLAVVGFFGVLFYVKSHKSFDVITRFSRNRGSLFNTPFFARFDNTDEHLIIDTQSIGGSILDVSKSFDNPMYGEGSSADKHHENPLYDVVKEKPKDEAEE